MTRIFTEGFEMGDGRFWTVQEGNVSGTARSGVYSYAPYTNPYKTIPHLSEFYARFAMRRQTVDNFFTGLPIFYAGYDGTRNLELFAVGSYLKAYINGTLVSTGKTVLTPDTWYLIEVHFKIADSGGIVDIKLDGGNESSFVGDTKPNANLTVNRLMWCGIGGALVNYIDDLALNDTTGEEDSGWCQDGHIILLKPNADSTPLQMTPSTGTSHFALIDEIPANTTDYVSGSVAGLVDVFDIEAFTPLKQDITRIWVEARALDSLAEGGYISLGYQPDGGSINWSGSIIQLVSLTQSKSPEATLNPVSGSTWKKEDLDLLRVAVRSDSTEGGG